MEYWKILILALVQGAYAPVPRNRVVNDLVVARHRDSHGFGHRVPPVRRALDVGEQERHRPRRQRERRRRRLRHVRDQEPLDNTTRFIITHSDSIDPGPHANIRHLVDAKGLRRPDPEAGQPRSAAVTARG